MKHIYDDSSFDTEDNHLTYSGVRIRSVSSHVKLNFRNVFLFLGMFALPLSKLLKSKSRFFVWSVFAKLFAHKFLTTDFLSAHGIPDLYRPRQVGAWREIVPTESQWLPVVAVSRTHPWICLKHVFSWNLKSYFRGIIRKCPTVENVWSQLRKKELALLESAFFETGKKGPIISSTFCEWVCECSPMCEGSSKNGERSQIHSQTLKKLVPACFLQLHDSKRNQHLKVFWIKWGRLYFSFDSFWSLLLDLGRVFVLKWRIATVASHDMLFGFQIATPTKAVHVVPRR